jgi:hypothetical protein
LPSFLIFAWGNAKLVFEDATVDNGCLSVMPEAHHQGLRDQLILSSTGELSFSVLFKSQLVASFIDRAHESLIA